MYRRISAASALNEKAIRFVLVGAITAGIYFLVLHISINYIAVKPEIGVIVAYILAIIINYSIHQYWTYGSPDKIRRTWYKFFLVNALILAFNVAITRYLPPLTGMDLLHVQIVFGLVAASLTFVAQLKWVFRRRD